MQIEVIGYKGVVGSATFELLTRLGHNVTGSDSGEQINSANLYVICVPEDFVEEVIKELADAHNGLIIVRSTTPIGLISNLMKKYKRHICHWPEHLREATSFYDCYFPDLINIGECCEEHGDILTSLLEPIGKTVLRSDITTSEASKYAINCFKAMVITFWNEFYELSQRLEFNPHLAARIASNDPVVPTYGTILGKAYGGKCLPKDMRALIATCQRAGYEPKLMMTAEEINNRLREEHGESQIKTR